MSSLSEQVAEVTDAAGILPKGGRVLVAVSGGVDSMVLLHLLHELAPARKWKLVVAHLNHQLRGRSSDADARFVETHCARMGLSCVLGRQDVKRIAMRGKVSLEMAAREVRHGFLAQTARRRRCSLIALAHQADDQAELVLLRLLRGSGSEGLGGMKRVAPSPVAPNIRLVRPLLEVSRLQIEAFAAETRIKFREDKSNTELRHLRNRVRHELLPLLQEHYQPAMGRVLVRTAAILSAEADCINEWAAGWLRDASGVFDELPLAVRRRVIQLQAIELGVPLEFDASEQLVHRAGQTVNAPGGEALRRTVAGKLSRNRPGDLTHLDDFCSVRLSENGSVQFAGQDFRWQVRAFRKGNRSASRANEESFDAELVGQRIVLRHWRAGDRFQPIGMSASVKLQDLFTNLKVPAVDRRKRVVAESEAGEVFWVEGLRIGERFKLRPNTRKRLVWRWNC